MPAPAVGTGGIARVSRVLVRLLPMMVLLLGCDGRDPLAEAPPGAWLVGSAAELDPLLDRLTAWTGTTIAMVTRPVAAKVAACPDQVLIGLPADAELPTVSCTIPAEWAPLADAARGHSAAFLLPESDIGRMSGTLDVSAGGAFTAQGSLPEPPGGTAWDLLLPGEGDPGPDALPREGALVHARVRQARVVDIASMSGPAGREEDVFGLDAQLFAASVLSGTWEFAAWPAAEGGSVPRVALAVGVRNDTIARVTAEQYVGSLSGRWPFVASPQDIAGRSATCLAGLNLLPELTPCWVVDDGNILVAWNAASLGRASEGGTGHAKTSEVVVHLGAFPPADAALTRAFAPPDVPPPADNYPWRDLVITARREDDRVHVTLVGVSR